MPAQRQDILSRGGVTQPDGSVPAGTGQPSAVPAKGHADDTSLVAVEGENLVPIANVPDPDLAADNQADRPGDLPAVRAEGHADDRDRETKAAGLKPLHGLPGR